MDDDALRERLRAAATTRVDIAEGRAKVTRRVGRMRRRRSVLGSVAALALVGAGTAGAMSLADDGPNELDEQVVATSPDPGSSTTTSVPATSTTTGAASTDTAVVEVATTLPASTTVTTEVADPATSTSTDSTVAAGTRPTSVTTRPPATNPVTTAAPSSVPQPTTTAPTSTAPATTAPSTTEPGATSTTLTTTTTTRPSTTTTAGAPFTQSCSGNSVTVQANGATLQLVSVTPAIGYTASPQVEPTEIEVTFSGPGGSVKVVIHYEDRRIEGECE